MACEFTDSERKENISRRYIYPLHPEVKEERANKARENAISDHDDILSTFKDELLNDKYLNENIRKELMKKR